MKSLHYSEYLYNKLNRNLSILVLILLFIAGVRLYQEVKMKNDLELVREILTLEKQLTEFKDSIYRSDMALRLFNSDPKIASNQFVGIRPVYAKQLIHTLLNRYNLFGLTASFPVPLIRYETTDHDFVLISYNKGDINFYSQTDADAYNFVNELEKTIGGYFQITSLKVTKIEKTAGQDAPMSRPLFYSKIQFIWQDLILNDQVTEAESRSK